MFDSMRNESLICKLLMWSSMLVHDMRREK